MEKRYQLSIFALLTPLLMANSPVPVGYPSTYIDYELVDERVEIVEEESTKYVLIGGTIINEGEGIIKLSNSAVHYLFDEEHSHSVYFDEIKFVDYIEAILPDDFYSYEVRFAYDGTSPIGDFAYQERIVQIAGFSKNDILDDIDYSNHRISLYSYQEEDDYTAAKLYFDWDNRIHLDVREVIVSFTIGGQAVVKDLSFNISLHHPNWASMSIPGDVSDQEISDLVLFFVRPEPVRYEWSWLAFFFWLIIASIALIIIVPIIVIVIALIKNRSQIKTL